MSITVGIILLLILCLVAPILPALEIGDWYADRLAAIERGELQ